MIKILKITLILLLINVFAYAQNPPTTHLQWFAKNPDDAAESIVSHYEKYGDKLIALDDSPIHTFDQRGQKTSKIKEIFRVLAFETGTKAYIRFNLENKITKLVFSFNNSPSYLQLKASLNLATFKIIAQSENFEQYQNRDLNIFVYIESKISPTGLVKKAYKVEVLKNVDGISFTPAKFNLDSISINKSSESIMNQINSLLVSKGFKYINETEPNSILNQDYSLDYYTKQYLYSDNLNVIFNLFPSMKVFSISISSEKPLVQFKILRIFFDEILANLQGSNSNFKEIVSDNSNPDISNAIPFNNNFIYKLKDKSIYIDFYFDKTEISDQLKNTAPFSIEKLLSFKLKDDKLKNLLCNAHYDFEQNTLSPCIHVPHIENSIYSKTADEHVICYYLSTDKKMVQVTYCNKPSTDHPIRIQSKDILFVSKLLTDFKDSGISNKYIISEISTTGFKVLDKEVINATENLKKQTQTENQEKQRIADLEQERRNEEYRIRREREAQKTNQKMEQWNNTLNQVIQTIKKKQ